jgi:hypothetical protein
MIKLLQSSRSVLLLIIVFAMALFFGLNQPGLISGLINSGEHVTEIALIVDSQCSPVGSPCMSMGDDLSMEFQLGPDISAMRKFPIQVKTRKLPDLVIDNVRIEFKMQGMEMGQNNFLLQASDDNTWDGHAILPVCVSGRSDWMARVVASSGSNEYVAEYYFMVQ